MTFWRGPKAKPGPVAGNVEYAFDHEGISVLAGWSRIDPIPLPAWIDSHAYRYIRADANEVAGLPAATTSGFILVVAGTENGTADALRSATAEALRVVGIDGTPLGFDDFVKGGTAVMGLMNSAVRDMLARREPGRLQPIITLLRALGDFATQEIVPASSAFRAHVDFAFSVDSIHRVVLCGWGPRGSDIFVLADGQTPNHRAASVTWMTRADVLDEVGSGYGGFVATCNAPVSASEFLRLSLRLRGLTTVIEVPITNIASADPLEVVRVLFEIPTHARDFVRTLEDGVGEIVSELIGRRNAARRLDSYAVLRDGGRDGADLSIIVPLYRRNDLLWNQFMSWAAGTDVSRIEFILVNDDPGTDIECAELVERLHAVFDVPITLVSNEENRGFAGACNIGARVAKGRTILFLNSDAILDSLDGAVNGVALLDENPQIGIVGALILGPDGLVAHSGMSCVYLPSRSSWFNYHPNSGVSPERSGDVKWWLADAVTGAVMLVRRDDFLTMGGFSEDFLIGDYEDSDLCWRMRESGREVAVLASLSAVHMERTSMSLIGNDEFREKVSLYNSWLHARRWGPFLEERYAELSKTDSS